MKKLSFAFVAVAVMMLSATAFGFADTAKEEIKPISAERVETIADTIVVEKGFVNKPKDFVLATVNDALVVSGTGRENDRVTITMYTRSGKEYVPMGEVVELKIGPLGVFTKELSLKEASTSSPKEAVVSKETFIVLELKRGEATTWDYRLIRFNDDKDVKKSLESLKSPMLSPAVK